MNNGWMSRSYRWLKRPRSRGQAATEFTLLLMMLLTGLLGIATFTPDMFSAFTMYVCGFYIVLGYPLG